MQEALWCYAAAQVYEDELLEKYDGVMMTRLLYHPSTPYSLHLYLGVNPPPRAMAIVASSNTTAAESDKVSHWEFHRDLLWCGLHVDVGIGDVRVEPAPDEESVKVTLVANGEPFYFTLLRHTVRVFMEDAHRLVPLGRESDFLDFEDELVRLLR